MDDLLDQRSEIDAVEPNPGTVELLRFNLWLNHVDATVWPAALSNERRALPLSVAENNLGDTRGVSLLPDEAYSLVVPAIDGDELFRGRGFDVVKIDVQGWETEVLLGMQRILHESPKIAIVVEFWPSALRQRGLDPQQVLDGYRRMGLRSIVVREEAVEELTDRGVIAMCDSAGPDGSVNLLLRRR